jgi:hypothetical protein
MPRRLAALSLMLWLAPLAASAEPGASAPAPGTESTERQPDSDPPADQTDQGVPWGAILAGCLGVGFGGLIAAWQIKGLAKRR